MTKICTMCNLAKPLTDFYKSVRKDRPNGLNYKYHTYCKECTKKKARDLYSQSDMREKRLEYYRTKCNDPSYKMKSNIRSRNFYNSNEGRAKTLLNSARSRAHKYSEFDLDDAFILEKITKGRCEVTGIPFDMSSPVGTFKNPYSPSIDRIDNKKGYTKTNTRIVLWQVNLMHGELSDDEFLEICKAVVEGMTK